MAGGGIVSAYHVVSLSGGKDSTAMLIMMLERGMPVDEVVWFDTGWEFPAMVGHIGKVEAETGVPVTRLRPDLPFNYWMFDHVRMKGARAGEAGYGWARMGSRWCTKIKTSAIDRHVKAMAGRRTVEQLERRFAFEDCQTTVLGYIAEREAMERRANDGGYGSGACIASERQGD